MIDRGTGGVIVNLSSQASSRAILNHASYCASKGALDQLTRVMALELGPHQARRSAPRPRAGTRPLTPPAASLQIRVNAVNPTVVMTPMGRRNWSDPAKGGPMLARIPLGRFAGARAARGRRCAPAMRDRNESRGCARAEIEEVVDAVVFLLSDRSTMINGAMLPIDGGYWAV